MCVSRRRKNNNPTYSTIQKFYAGMEKLWQTKNAFKNRSFFYFDENPYVVGPPFPFKTASILLGTFALGW